MFQGSEADWLTRRWPLPFAPSTTPLRYDFVEVRDGADESGQLVGKYCGKIAPSPIVSAGNQLYIKFVSDYETHGAGFSIRYEIFKTGRPLAHHCGDHARGHDNILKHHKRAGGACSQWEAESDICSMEHVHIVLSSVTSGYKIWVLMLKV